MRQNRLILRINLGIIISYFAVKFWLRPLVLERDSSEFLKIFVLSYPNLCEAVAGTLVLTMMIRMLDDRVLQKSLNVYYVYIAATLLAGAYVILQEFKIHTIGGENIYDPYDVLFSVLGLIIAYLILLKIKP